MRGLGVLLIVFAIGSALLPYLGMQFILVGWIDSWGETTAWIIRATMFVLGIVMLTAGTRKLQRA